MLSLILVNYTQVVASLGQLLCLNFVSLLLCLAKLYLLLQLNLRIFQLSLCHVISLFPWLSPYSRLLSSLCHWHFDLQGQLSVSSTVSWTKTIFGPFQCLFASLFAAHSSLSWVHPLNHVFLHCWCLFWGGTDWTYCLFWQFDSVSPLSPLRTTLLMH